MTDELQQLRAQFFQELDSATEDLEQDLMHLEQSPDDMETYKTLRREIHTIKGNSGLVGETELQSFCHALESSLERLYSREQPLAAAELGLQAVDLLREAAAKQDGRVVTDRITGLGENLHSAGQPPGESDASWKGPTHVGTGLSLKSWKWLMRSFGVVETASNAIISGEVTQRQIRRAGASAVDFAEAARICDDRVSELASLFELTLQGLLALPPDSLAPALEAFGPLLQGMIAMSRDRLTELFRENSFSVTVTVRDLSLLSALEAELRTRKNAPILILRIDIDYQALERDNSVYDSFWSLASMPEHTVAFVLPWSSMVEKAAQFLENAIGTVPLISSHEWETLLQIARHQTEDE